MRDLAYMGTTNPQPSLVTTTPATTTTTTTENTTLTFEMSPQQQLSLPPTPARQGNETADLQLQQLQLPWTPYLYAAAAAMTTVAYGFNVAIMTVAFLSLAKRWQPTPLQTTLIVSSMLGGATVGALAANRDRTGRKPMLLVANALLAVGAFASAASPTVWTLIASRFVVGIGVGLGSILPGLLITEMSPAGVRGQLGVFNQISGFVGVVLSHLVGLGVIHVAGQQADIAGVLFQIAGAVAVGSLAVAAAWLPESPRWLIGHGRAAAGLAVLQKLHGGVENAAECQREYNQAVGALKAATAAPISALPWRLWLLVLGLQVVQQAAGSGFLTYYTAIIFRAWGLSPEASVAATLLSTLPQLAVIAVTLKWRLVETLGRKRLLLHSTVAVSIVLAYLSGICRAGDWLRAEYGQVIFAALLLIGLMAHRVAYAFGLASVPSVLIAESVPFVHRTRVLSLALALNWALNCVLTTTVSVCVGGDLAGGLEKVYAGLAVGVGLVGCVFIGQVVKETRGMALEAAGGIHLSNRGGCEASS